MIKKITFFFLLFFLSIISYSQIPVLHNYFDKNLTEIADSIFQNKNEISFNFKAESKNQVDEIITHIVSVDAFNSATLTVRAYASKKQFIKFLELKIPFAIIEKKNNSKVINMAATIAQMSAWNRYPYYQVYDSMMTKYQTTHPNLCKRYELVTLASGRKLIVLKITNNVNTKAAKPQFLYSSTMHGDEVTGYVMMLRLIDYLLSNYGTNSRITNILNNIELWILPVSNPDGTYYNSSPSGYSITNAQRYNANDVDLNRNYPDPSTGAHPDGNAYQPETQALMNFADTMNFVMSANFHGGSDVVNFPWDDWTSATKKTADDLWWRYVATNFADSAQASTINHYFKETYPSGITEGGDWYVITGGRQDYMNYFKHCREVTIELSDTKELSSDSLPTYWTALQGSFLKYIEECKNGFNGIISDSCTGVPIKAKVFVSSHDVDSSWVWSGSQFGNYYRPIKAGTWSVTYSATGYTPKTISITTTDGNAVIKNIKLMPVAPKYPVSNFTFSALGGTVNFTNTSTNGVTYLWDFGDSTTSIAKNPLHTFTKSGVYTVQLTVYNGCGNNVSSQQIIMVGIKSFNASNKIEVYPNPASSDITISFNSESNQNVDISIIDILGSKIYNNNNNNSIITGNNNISIDLSEFKQGVYFICITTPAEKFYHKFIKN